MNTDKLFKSPYNKLIADAMFEAKKPELLKVAEKYNTTFDDLKKVIDKELTNSRMKVGGCNTAVGFFIIETPDENKLYPTVEKGISSNILASAIYWVNGMDKAEYV